MSRLRKFNRLCSRTVSDTANRQRNGRTHWSAPTVEKILCRSPYFAAVTCRQSAPDYPRERGDSQEGGNRRCLPSCAPARRQRNSPLRFSEKDCRPDRANTPAAVRVPRSVGAEKSCRPSGANPLTQFAHPAQPVLRKRLPPGQGEHAYAVRVPRSPGAEKIACAVRIPPVALCRENEKGTARAVPLSIADMLAAQQQQLPQLPQPPQVLSPQVPQEPQPPLP